MEISDNKTINKLWKLPDSGKISNPYFGGQRDLETNNASTSCTNNEPNRTTEDGPKHIAKENNSHAKNVRSKNDSNVIPFIELDDTDSVNTPSTTDESDDSLNNDQSKVNDIKKKKQAKKKVVKDQIGDSNAVKAQGESKIIPGLGPNKLTTTIEKIDETPEPPKETINNQPTQYASQLSTDNLVQPMETDKVPTNTNEINKQSTVNVTNGTQPPGYDELQFDKPKCHRVGCCDPPVENPEWDFEYCSSKCAVQHCKIAFTNWVIARQLEFTNSSTTTPSSTVTTVTI